MDKKRVFNAAVTAGLSLSMVLTSVPATALAQGESVLAKNNLSEAAQYGVWVSNWDTGEALYSGDNIKWSAGTTLENIVPNIAVNITVPEGKTIQWVGANGQPLDLSTVINEDTFIYVKFVDDASEPEAHYITYKVVDEEGNDLGQTIQVLSTDEVLSYSGAVPSKEGYTFAYFTWPGYDEPIKEGAVPVTWTDTIVAHFTKDAVEEPEQRYITVHLYDGDEFIRDVVVLNNSSIWSGVLDAPTKDGYIFVGWQQDGASDIMTDLESVVISADDQVSELTFRAVWEKDVDPYEGYITVNYYDGDELLGTGAVKNGTNEWSGVDSPTKDGYVFDGWNFEGDTEHLYKDLSTVRYAGDETVKEINLYANWTKIEDPYADYINVNYWDGEELLGTGAVKNGTTEWSGVVSPSKDGYTFIGWNFEGDTEHLYTDLSTVRYAGDETVTEINVYANWKKNADPETETHKVTFDDCLSNTTNLVVEVEDGNSVAEPPAPTCDGWTFLGWYSDTALTQAWDFSVPVTSDMTLWAKWEKNVDEVIPGDDAATPETPQESEEAKSEVPETGDATNAVAVTGIGIAGLMAAAASFILRRRNEQ